MKHGGGGRECAPTGSAWRRHHAHEEGGGARRRARRATQRLSATWPPCPPRSAGGQGRPAQSCTGRQVCSCAIPAGFVRQVAHQSRISLYRDGWRESGNAHTSVESPPITGAWREGGYPPAFFQKRRASVHTRGHGQWRRATLRSTRHPTQKGRDRPSLDGHDRGHTTAAHSSCGSDAPWQTGCPHTPHPRRLCSRVTPPTHADTVVGV